MIEILYFCSYCSFVNTHCIYFILYSFLTYSKGCELFERYQNAGWKRHRVKLCPKRDGKTQFQLQYPITALSGNPKLSRKNLRLLLYSHINSTRALMKSDWLHETNARKQWDQIQQSISKKYQFRKWFNAAEYAVNPVRVLYNCAVSTYRPIFLKFDLMTSSHYMISFFICDV